ncbi:unnamed protein product [Brassica rapa subsp. narinosa]
MHRPILFEHERRSTSSYCDTHRRNRLSDSFAQFFIMIYFLLRYWAE